MDARTGKAEDRDVGALERRNETSSRPVLTVLALTACSTEGTSGTRTATDRRCFWASQANSFQAIDERTVHVRVGVNDIYRLTLFGPCNDIDWANRIALVSRGGSLICDGHSAEIVTNTARGRRRCSISNVQQLTADEVAALPARQRP